MARSNTAREDANPAVHASYWHLLLVVGLCSVLSNTSSMRDGRQHPDELNWVSRSYFYRLAFMERNLSSERWHSIDSLDQPHVSDFLIGLTLHALGQAVPQVPERDWCWVGAPRLEPGRLWYARIPATILGSAVAPMVFLLGMRLSGRPLVGFVSGLLYAFHPVPLLSQPRAMSDGPLIFFSTLSVLFLTLSWPERSTSGSAPGLRWILVAMGSLAAGLATGAKLSGLVVVAVILLAVTIRAIFSLLREPRDLSGQVLRWAVGAWVLTPVCVVAVNPTLYPAPAARLQAMLRYRWDESRAQALTYEADALHGRLEQVAALASRLALDDAELRHPTFIGMHVALAAAGLVTLVALEMTHLRAGRASPQLLLLAWLVVLAVVLLPSLPLRWIRYYLPFVPAWELLTGYGTVPLAWLWERSWPGPSTRNSRPEVQPRPGRELILSPSSEPEP